MDNITQGVIGGWIMDKVVGEAPEKASWRQRNKAFILGGFIANIPDLDIFISRIVPHKDYMSEFLFHRSMSHSVFFNILVALLVGWICGKTDRYNRPWWRWALASYLSILLGHLLIDAMTAYGGRYLLPFSTHTYSFNNIFVIDLFYTIPLIILRFGYIFLKDKIARRTWYIIGAIWIVLYPVFTFFAKYTANNAFADSLQAQNIPFSRMTSAPEPLQAFLRRGVVQGGQGYYEGYYSLFDKDKNISWRYLPTNTAVRKLIEEKSDVKRIEDWAQGRTAYRGDGSGHILINAVKMGGTLGRIGSGDSNFSFMLSPEGQVLGQSRMGGSRFASGFSNTWDQHWKRVWGNK